MSKCAKNMFPSKLDLTKDECRGALRRLELEAYSSVISTFRAQGNLDNSKQNVLDQLRRCFHISEDRHKAEVRRVANNEKLTTISELLNGKSFDLEWIREGHRTYPLISRAPSYSALHILADHASKVAAFENSNLPDPCDTKREKNLDIEITGKPIILDDPSKPPTITTPAIFGVSRKDLKRSIDLVTLHPHSKKKHYHLKPPPPPNVKIQHLYQTLNTKRPRKSFTKKPKTKTSKQSPARMQYPYPSIPDEKHFDGAELQKHLTSQLMPPPMSPMKLTFNQSLPTTKKEMNLIKMNNQTLEPQAHYIPNNRLKNELLGESTTRARSGRSKSISVPLKNNYTQKYANGAGSRSNNNNNMDHIPDPQIIFNTTSSSKMESSIVDTISHENNEMDLSPDMRSPLQLLSTAASCTPKLKITSPINHLQPQLQLQQQQQSHQQQQQQQTIHQQPSTSATQLPSLTNTPSPLKTVQNRAIKIIPANSKPVIIKPQNTDILKSPQQQTIISTTPSKFKIQKIQLVMNKNQDGTTAPSATIVSGKAGQLVLSGKGITNTYQAKAPYTILSSTAKSIGSGPKVIVQTIDRNFVQAQKESNEITTTSNERIPENQRITENTPIDFLPVSTTVASTSFPKVIIQKSATAPKQIKLKLGPGSIMNSKIIKGPLPGNIKIQRNINTKGFTVLNTSLLNTVQIQSAPITPIASNESTKVDWEQELDDANRTKERFVESNGSSIAKKPRLEESPSTTTETTLQEVVQTNENIIVDSSNVELNSNNIIYAEDLPQIEAVQTNPTSQEYVYIDTSEEIKQTENSLQEINGEEECTRINGQFEEVEEQRTHNGAEAYENLVKSLATECDTDYIKEITDDPQIDEGFELIDGNILDSTIPFARETERLFQ